MKKGLNAGEVLTNLEAVLAENKSVRTRSVCYELEIFDWWTENLPVTKQKEMRSFLRLAIKLGYTGYVCFKVGARGCANGMWAYKDESTTGYSPDGEMLYRSFSPDYVYYDIRFADGSWLTNDRKYDSVGTAAQLKRELAERHEC